MKTILTEQSVVDLLVVARDLPADEIAQIEAFTGVKYDAEVTALAMANMPGPKWTIKVKETYEPIVVAGLAPIGSVAWRTWFLATPKAWSDYGKEVSLHTARTRKEMLETVDVARIETVCLATRKKAQEWYEAVGMTYESTMRGYGANGESAVMYVSVKGARNY